MVIILALVLSFLFSSLILIITIITTVIIDIMTNEDDLEQLLHGQLLPGEGFDGSDGKQ